MPALFLLLVKISSNNFLTSDKMNTVDVTEIKSKISEKNKKQNI